MKILIVSCFFPPRNSIASLRPYSWAKYWAAMGHEVVVLTTYKTPQDNDLNLVIDGFKVIEVKTYIFEKVKPLRARFFGTSQMASVEKKDSNTSLNLLKKMLVWLNERRKERGVACSARMPDIYDLWKTSAIKSVEHEKWDLIVSTHGPYVCHSIAYELKKRGLTKKWIADYRDLWTQNHFFKGLFPFTILEKRLEQKYNKAADIITTVSEPLKEKLSIQKVYVIENGFDIDDLKNISKKPIFDNKKIRIVYTGAIYKTRQDPSPLFKAIAQLKNSPDASLLKQLEVLFVGGSMGDLTELIGKYEVEEYVKYGGLISHDDALRMQRDAHALLLLEVNNEDGILTGKLFEYLCSGTPIWGVGVSKKIGPEKLIEQYKAGINFGNDDKKILDDLKKLLIDASKKPVVVSEEVLQKYTRKYLAEKLIKLTNDE